ncbi:MAG: 2-dehydropantoate 2-reductase [Gammaproteobacteria bacterium]|jgi:2-dehydropantoate 2-reductase
MKLAIVGVGAMGSVYAAVFAEAGHEVWAIDLWQDHVDAINSHGLRVVGPGRDRVVRGINATTRLRDAGRCDYYVIATKADGVGPAASAIVDIMGTDSMIITIQNGLGAAERIEAFMPTDNVLLGVADGFGASMKGPGYAHHNAMNLIRMGEIKGGASDRLEQVTRLWQDAGFKAQSFDDIDQLIWGKFICNATFSGPCTVFDATLGELMANAEAWEIALGCTREIFALGRAKGVDFSFTDPVEYVTAFGRKMPDARPSMLLDHQAGKLSEIDAINGMAKVLGDRLGITTPYNQTISALVRDRESKFTPV